QDLAPGAVALVEEAPPGEPAQGLLVQRLAPGLEVRGTGAAHVRPLVPVQPEPAQVAELPLQVLRPHPPRVQVLHPYDEAPAGGAHLEPGEQRRAGVHEMEVPRGARREPPPRPLTGRPASGPPAPPARDG